MGDHVSLGHRASAAAGFVLIWIGIGLSGCAVAGEPAGADDLAGTAIRSIIEAKELVYQGVSSTSVNGHALPTSPSFAGTVTSGQRLVLEIRPDAAANGTREETVYTRGSAGVWTTENNAENSGLTMLNWNPLPWLEQLPQVKRQAALDAKQSDAETRAVTIALESSEVKRLVTDELTRERNGLEAKLLAERNAVPQGLSAAQAAARDAAMTEAAQAAIRRLDESLGGLQAEGTITLWLDRTNHRPNKLTLNTKLRYPSGDRTVEENTVTSYTFEEERKDTMLPSTS
ncbi:hypothetical protein ACFFK0_12120 [Paenibacillus chartarius]|uniref:LppX_LprAFG lipoprotein n=1 Tax=Paenibacillus chartarius TaxID=747481 RepID=A0ABV6DKR8_9BACL